METAIVLFGKYGYDQTTIADISFASGLSSGSIYNFFWNKAGIVRDCIKETFFSAKSCLQENVNNKKDLGRCILEYYLFISTEIERYSFDTIKAANEACSMEYRSGKEQEYLELSHQNIVLYLKNAQTQGFFNTEDSIEDLVEFVHMEFMGCLMTWLYYPLHPDLIHTTKANITKILQLIDLL